MPVGHNPESNHDLFRELSALSHTGVLTDAERAALTEHLEQCEECRQVHEEYAVLTHHGLPFLTADLAESCEDAATSQWDEDARHQAVFDRIEAHRGRRLQEAKPQRSGLLARGVVWKPIAACLVAGAMFGAYRFGAAAASEKAMTVAPPIVTRGDSSGEIAELALQKQSLSERLQSKTKRLEQLEAQMQTKEVELDRLRAELVNHEARLSELAAARDASETRVQAAHQQRDALTERLQTAERNVAGQRTEIATVRAERDRTRAQMSGFESRIRELSSTNSDLERRLATSEKFLASNRDIRELIGARNLYISDVFDVDSNSRTQKPFGRVFYTQGRSLIFYAFDLDGSPGMKKANVNAFQVWGSKTGDERSALNMGILYEDSKANRRWVLRFDDARQLADIKAVFVTAEPDGGSARPTGKPFLYALLRKEVNHP